jgi:hypothetical protein
MASCAPIGNRRRSGCQPAPLFLPSSFPLQLGLIGLKLALQGHNKPKQTQSKANLEQPLYLVFQQLRLKKLALVAIYGIFWFNQAPIVG